MIKIQFHLHLAQDYSAPLFIRLSHHGELLPLVQTASRSFTRELEVSTFRTHLKVAVYTKDGEHTSPIGLDFSQETPYIILNLYSFPHETKIEKKGELLFFPEFPSKNLVTPHRGISVWLPPSYKMTSANYPVIYLHDGQMIFGSDRAWNKTTWHVAETVERLIQEKKIPEVILIAIDNPPSKRYEEFVYPHGGRGYAAFIKEELKPFIDSRYRTIKGREATFTIGSSFGAFLSFYLLWAHSDLFSKAGCLSFPLTKKYEFYADLIKDQRPKNSIYAWVDHGTHYIDHEYEKLTAPFIRNLYEMGFSSSEIEYQIFKNTGHHESDWANRVDLLLMRFFQNYSI